MKPTIKTVEQLSGTRPLKEIELMLTMEELALFGAYCTRNDIKFNDWVRQLAHDALRQGQREKGSQASQDTP